MIYSSLEQFPTLHTSEKQPPNYLNVILVFFITFLNVRKGWQKDSNLAIQDHNNHEIHGPWNCDSNKIKVGVNIGLACSCNIILINSCKSRDRTFRMILVCHANPKGWNCSLNKYQQEPPTLRDQKMPRVSSNSSSCLQFIFSKTCWNICSYKNSLVVTAVSSATFRSLACRRAGRPVDNIMQISCIKKK